MKKFKKIVRLEVDFYNLLVAGEKFMEPLSRE